MQLKLALIVSLPLAAFNNYCMNTTTTTITKKNSSILTRKTQFNVLCSQQNWSEALKLLEAGVDLDPTGTLEQALSAHDLPIESSLLKRLIENRASINLNTLKFAIKRAIYLKNVSQLKLIYYFTQPKPTPNYVENMLAEAERALFYEEYHYKLYCDFDTSYREKLSKIALFKQELKNFLTNPHYSIAEKLEFSLLENKISQQSKTYNLLKKSNFGKDIIIKIQ